MSIFIEDDEHNEDREVKEDGGDSEGSDHGAGANLGINSTESDDGADDNNNGYNDNASGEDGVFDPHFFDEVMEYEENADNTHLRRKRKLPSDDEDEVTTSKSHRCLIFPKEEEDFVGGYDTVAHEDSDPYGGFI